MLSVRYQGIGPLVHASIHEVRSSNHISWQALPVTLPWHPTIRCDPLVTSATPQRIEMFVVPARCLCRLRQVVVFRGGGETAVSEDGFDDLHVLGIGEGDRGGCRMTEGVR